MRVRDLFRYFHTAIFGFTAVLPFIGAGTAVGTVTGWKIGGLLATAVCYHIFAYLLNDLIDLPLDRTQPSRAEYPLVRGVVTVRQTWILTVAQLFLLLLLWGLMAGNGRSSLYLCWAVGGMTIYNLWGKRSPLPPLTDLVQGSSWGALILYGASVVGEPSPQTWTAVGFMIVYILLVNGINGSLRDLKNDYEFGAKTTAIWLGARLFPDNCFSIPTRLTIYALFWNIVLSLLAAVLPIADKFPLAVGEHTPWLLSFVIQMLATLSTVLMWNITRAKVVVGKIMPWLMVHNILMLLMLFTAVLPIIDPLPRWAIILSFTLPLLTADWLADFLNSSVNGTQINAENR